MIAQRNLLSCKMQHDACRSTKRHKYAGQNLAMGCGWSSVQQAIDQSLKMWWNEHKSITQINNKNMYTSIRSRGKYGHGHFTQMARDKAFAIGCAVISTSNDHCWYVACNYAVTNWLGSPVYVRGKVRNRCKTKSSKYPGLCGAKEDYSGYKVKGISFFSRRKIDSPILQQWQQNGKRLNVRNAPNQGKQNKKSKNQKKKAPKRQTQSKTFYNGNFNMNNLPKDVRKNTAKFQKSGKGGPFDFRF